MELAPFTFFAPSLSSGDLELVTAYLRRQPPEVWQWVGQQTGRYGVAARRWPRATHQAAAMLDCLLWQYDQVLTRNAGRFDQIAEAIRKLRGLDEIVRTLPRPARRKEIPHDPPSRN